MPPFLAEKVVPPRHERINEEGLLSGIEFKYFRACPEMSPAAKLKRAYDRLILCLFNIVTEAGLRKSNHKISSLLIIEKLV